MILPTHACSFSRIIQTHNSSTLALERTLLLQNSLDWWQRSSTSAAQSFTTPQNPTARLESSWTFRAFQLWAGRPRSLCEKDLQEPTLITWRTWYESADGQTLVRVDRRCFPTTGSIVKSGT